MAFLKKLLPGGSGKKDLDGKSPRGSPRGSNSVPLKRLLLDYDSTLNPGQGNQPLTEERAALLRRFLSSWVEQKLEIYVLTSSNPEKKQEALQAAGLLELFTDVLSSSMPKKYATKGDYISKRMRDDGWQPGEQLLADDSIEAIQSIWQDADGAARGPLAHTLRLPQHSTTGLVEADLTLIDSQVKNAKGDKFVHIYSFQFQNRRVVDLSDSLEKCTLDSLPEDQRAAVLNANPPASRRPWTAGRRDFAALCTATRKPTGESAPGSQAATSFASESQAPPEEEGDKSNEGVKAARRLPAPGTVASQHAETSSDLSPSDAAPVPEGAAVDPARPPAVSFTVTACKTMMLEGGGDTEDAYEKIRGIASTDDAQAEIMREVDRRLEEQRNATADPAAAAAAAAEATRAEAAAAGAAFAPGAAAAAAAAAAAVAAAAVVDPAPAGAPAAETAPAAPARSSIMSSLRKSISGIPGMPSLSKSTAEATVAADAVASAEAETASPAPAKGKGAPPKGKGKGKAPAAATEAAPPAEGDVAPAAETAPAATPPEAAPAVASDAAPSAEAETASPAPAKGKGAPPKGKGKGKAPAAATEAAPPADGDVAPATETAPAATPQEIPKAGEDELEPNPDECPCFVPNSFNKEKCKNCGHTWRQHKGVISQELLDEYMGVPKAEAAPAVATDAAPSAEAATASPAPAKGKGAPPKGKGKGKAPAAATEAVPPAEGEVAPATEIAPAEPPMESVCRVVQLVESKEVAFTFVDDRVKPSKWKTVANVLKANRAFGGLKIAAQEDAEFFSLFCPKKDQPGEEQTGEPAEEQTAAPVADPTRPLTRLKTVKFASSEITEMVSSFPSEPEAQYQASFGMDVVTPYQETFQPPGDQSEVHPGYQYQNDVPAAVATPAEEGPRRSVMKRLTHSASQVTGLAFTTPAPEDAEEVAQRGRSQSIVTAHVARKSVVTGLMSMDTDAPVPFFSDRPPAPFFSETSDAVAPAKNAPESVAFGMQPVQAYACDNMAYFQEEDLSSAISRLEISADFVSCFTDSELGGEGGFDPLSFDTSALSTALDRLDRASARLMLL